MILDNVAEYFTVNTLPKPGGIIADEMIEKLDSNKVVVLEKYYKDKGLFEKSILSKDFIIYNQKAIDRVKIYSYLLNLFEEKNKELINLLNTNLKEH
jgi:hypothetical protein